MISSSIGSVGLTTALSARRIVKTRASRKVWSAIEEIKPSARNAHELLYQLHNFHQSLQNEGAISYDDVTNGQFVAVLRRHAAQYVAGMEGDVEAKTQTIIMGNSVHNLARAGHLTRSQLVPDVEWKRIINTKVEQSLRKAAQCKPGMIHAGWYSGKKSDECVDVWLMHVDSVLELGRMGRGDVGLTTPRLRALLDPHFEAVWKEFEQETDTTYFPQLKQLEWLLSETGRKHGDVIPEAEWRRVHIEKAHVCLKQAEEYVCHKQKLLAELRKQDEEEMRNFRPKSFPFRTDFVDIGSEIYFNHGRRYDPLGDADSIIIHSLSRMNAHLVYANAFRSDADVHLSTERIESALKIVQKLSTERKVELAKERE